MDRSRQTDLVHHVDEIHIIGAGGIGTHAALIAAMAGIPVIHIYDDDTYEESNLNRVPIPRKYVGKSKVMSIKKYIEKDMRIDDVVVIPHKQRVSSVEDMMQLDSWTFIAVDNAVPRNEISKFCRANDIKFVSASYDGNIVEIDTHFSFQEIWSLQDIGGYTMPSWAGAAYMAAAMGMAVVLSSESIPERTIVINLKEMEMHKTDE